MASAVCWACGEAAAHRHRTVGVALCGIECRQRTDAAVPTRMEADAPFVRLMARDAPSMHSRWRAHDAAHFIVPQAVAAALVAPQRIGPNRGRKRRGDASGRPSAAPVPAPSGVAVAPLSGAGGEWGFIDLMPPEIQRMAYASLSVTELLKLAVNGSRTAYLELVAKLRRILPNIEKMTAIIELGRPDIDLIFDGMMLALSFGNVADFNTIAHTAVLALYLNATRNVVSYGRNWINALMFPHMTFLVEAARRVPLSQTVDYHAALEGRLLQRLLWLSYIKRAGLVPPALFVARHRTDIPKPSPFDVWTDYEEHTLPHIAVGIVKLLTGLYLAEWYYLHQYGLADNQFSAINRAFVDAEPFVRLIDTDRLTPGAYVAGVYTPTSRVALTLNAELLDLVDEADAIVLSVGAPPYNVATLASVFPQAGIALPATAAAAAATAGGAVMSSSSSSPAAAAAVGGGAMMSSSSSSLASGAAPPSSASAAPPSRNWMDVDVDARIGALLIGPKRPSDSDAAGRPKQAVMSSSSGAPVAAAHNSDSDSSSSDSSSSDSSSSDSDSSSSSSSTSHGPVAEHQRPAITDLIMFIYREFFQPLGYKLLSARDVGHSAGDDESAIRAVVMIVSYVLRMLGRANDAARLLDQDSDLFVGGIVTAIMFNRRNIAAEDEELEHIAMVLGLGQIAAAVDDDVATPASIADAHAYVHKHWRAFLRDAIVAGVNSKASYAALILQMYVANDPEIKRGVDSFGLGRALSGIVSRHTTVRAGEAPRRSTMVAVAAAAIVSDMPLRFTLDTWAPGAAPLSITPIDFDAILAPPRRTPANF